MKSITSAILLVLPSCCPSNAPYSPASLPASLSLAPEKWVYIEGSSNAQDDAEKAMVHRGVELANAILLSDCFKYGVLGAPMSHTDSKTPADIYASMVQTPPKSLEIVLYNGGEKHGTVGWEDPAHPDKVHMNRFFVKTSYMVADNLLHEAAHVRGYIHKSPKEHRSVPYTMNWIFEKCAASAKAGNEPPLELSDSEAAD